LALKYLISHGLKWSTELKRLLAILIVLTCLMIMVPSNMVLAAGNTGPQSWSFDNETLGTNTSEMERNWGVGDDGQSGQVEIPSGGNHVWVADQKAAENVTYPSGFWALVIRTTSAWGTKGDGCSFEIGYWDGSFHTLTPSPNISHGGVSSLLNETLTQSGSITIPKGTWLAIMVKNLTDGTRIVKTGEDIGRSTRNNSYLRSPETDPGYPLPEVAAGVLLSLGLTGLAAFIIVRRKSFKAV
jgi:hypothetical protein